MNEEKPYEIYTDASFDSETKLGTYAIVVLQGNNIVKVISKKCKIKLEKSTECEIFAIFQAINLILSNLLNSNKKQKFWIRTDCSSASSFRLRWIPRESNKAAHKYAYAALQKN